jgi:hypothetical protein
MITIRISYVDHLTVRILGDKIQPPHHNAVTSSLDVKRKSHIQPGRVKWSSESSLVRELGLDTEVEAQAVAEELKEANAQLRKTNKDIAHTTACITGLKKAGGGSNSAEVSEVNDGSGSADGSSNMDDSDFCTSLKEWRTTLADLQTKKISLAEAVRNLKSTRYFWQKCSKTNPEKGSNTSYKETPPSVPTWEAHTEDYPQGTELGGLLDGVDYFHRVVASETDYGLSTMSVTVAILLDQVNNMLARYQSQGTSTSKPHRPFTMAKAN